MKAPKFFATVNLETPNRTDVVGHLSMRVRVRLTGLIQISLFFGCYDEDFQDLYLWIFYPSPDHDRFDSAND